MAWVQIFNGLATMCDNIWGKKYSTKERKPLFLRKVSGLFVGKYFTLLKSRSQWNRSGMCGFSLLFLNESTTTCGRVLVSTFGNVSNPKSSFKIGKISNQKRVHGLEF